MQPFTRSRRSRILRELAAKDSELRSLGQAVARIIEVLLAQEGIRVHSVVWRVKSPESTARKVQQSPGKYPGIAQMTDALGCRVITYFPDDVDNVARVIEQNFDVDVDNSVDRRATLEPDRFGYVSLHYVVGLPAHRRGLPEHAAHRDVKFEIQVRSILQHSWAEIEHDLGYKTVVAIPAPLRRRFSRLAGLLELADEEFRAIRDAVESYAVNVTEVVAAEDPDLPLDRETLVAFVETSEVVKRVEQRLLTVFGERTITRIEAFYASSRLDEMLDLDIGTTGELRAALEAREEQLVAFAAEWLRDGSSSEDEGAVSNGVALFYLHLLMTAERAAQDPSFEPEGVYSTGPSDTLRGRELRRALIRGLRAARRPARRATRRDTRPSNGAT